MAKGDRTRRRRLYFYPGFQPSFIWGLGGAVVAAGLAALFSLFILLVVQGRAVAVDVFPLLIGFNAVVVLALLVVVYWVALFISHRMGGPLYRLEAACKDLAQGRLNQRVDLRQNDQLQEMAAALNLGMSGLRERLVELRQELRELEKVGDPQEVRDRAKHLGRRMDELFQL